MAAVALLNQSQNSGINIVSIRTFFTIPLAAATTRTFFMCSSMNIKKSEISFFLSNHS